MDFSKLKGDIELKVNMSQLTPKWTRKLGSEYTKHLKGEDGLYKRLKNEDTISFYLMLFFGWIYLHYVKILMRLWFRSL